MVQSSTDYKPRLLLGILMFFFIKKSFLSNFLRFFYQNVSSESTGLSTDLSTGASTGEILQIR